MYEKNSELKPALFLLKIDFVLHFLDRGGVRSINICLNVEE